MSLIAAMHSIYVRFYLHPMQPLVVRGKGTVCVLDLSPCHVAWLFFLHFLSQLTYLIHFVAMYCNLLGQWVPHTIGFECRQPG